MALPSRLAQTLLVSSAICIPREHFRLRDSVFIPIDSKIVQVVFLRVGTIVVALVVGMHNSIKAGRVQIEDSFIIEGQRGSTFSAPGDSGSGIYDLKGRLVGFLYAGDGTITLACPAGAALEALGVRPRR